MESEEKYVLLYLIYVHAPFERCRRQKSVTSPPQVIPFLACIHRFFYGRSTFFFQSNNVTHITTFFDLFLYHFPYGILWHLSTTKVIHVFSFLSPCLSKNISNGLPHNSQISFILFSATPVEQFVTICFYHFLYFLYSKTSYSYRCQQND